MSSAENRAIAEDLMHRAEAAIGKRDVGFIIVLLEQLPDDRADAHIFHNIAPGAIRGVFKYVEGMIAEFTSFETKGSA